MMLGKIMLLLLSHAFFICCSEQEACPETPFISSHPINKGISNFGSNQGSDANFLAEIFVWTFTNAVQASDILTDVFDISHTTPTKMKNFVHDYIKASATTLGMESPHCVANIVANPIEIYFQTLVPSVIVKVYANTAAKLLQSDGILNATNVVKLANQYIFHLKEITIQNIVKGNPDWKLRSLMKGIEKFFTSLDLLVANKGDTLASIFANEVKSAGLNLENTSNL